MKRRTSEDNDALTPAEHYILQRMDDIGYVKGEWFVDGTFHWYLFEPQRQRYEELPANAVDQLIARQLVSSDHSARREHTLKLTQEGKRRARALDALKRRGRWSAGHDSESIVISHVERVKGEPDFTESWVYRWLAGDAQGRRTLVFVGGSSAAPREATALAWQVFNLNPEIKVMMEQRRRLLQSGVTPTGGSRQSND